MALQKARELLKTKTPDDRQAAAQVLYNAIVYLHPTDDGNGRAARTMYALVSGHVPHETFPKVLKRIIEDRPSSIKEFHSLLDQEIFCNLLEHRGLSTEIDTDGHYVNMMLDARTLGFDGVFLQFISAFDVLSDEEKNNFNKSSVNGAFSFEEFEFPPDVVHKIHAHMNDVRVEFAQLAIEISQEKWPDWLMERLDANFIETKNP